MDRDLIIKLGLDKSGADASGAQFLAEEKARIDKVTGAHQAAGTARTQSANKTAQAEQQAARATSAVQVAGIAKAREAMSQYAAEGASGLKDITTASGGLLTSLSSLAGGALVLSSLKAAAGGVVEMLREANSETQKQLDFLTQTKDLIREISMIRGSAEGPSDAEVMKFMDVRKASGLTNQQAKENQLEFEGGAAASKGKNIPEAEYERLKVQQARFAKAAGGGPDAAGTYGKLTGQLLALGHYDKAEDVLADLTQFNKILSQGVGDNPTLIKQEGKVAGAFVKENGPGIVKDSRELAAITATASRIDPDTVAETLKSTTRVIRGMDEKWAPMLKDAGVTEKDTYTEASNKVFKKIEEAEKSGRSGDVWLAEQGVDQHGAMNMMNMYRNRQMMNDINAEQGTYAPTQEQLDRGIRPGRKMTGKEAMEELDNKYKTDVTLRESMEDARGDAIKLGNAMPRQFYRTLQKEAVNNIALDGDGPENAAALADDSKAGWFANPNPMVDHQELGRKMRVEREMNRLAKKRGLTVPGRPEDTSPLGGTPLNYTAWLMGGGDVDAYSAVGTEQELRNRPGLGGPMGRGFQGPAQGGPRDAIPDDMKAERAARGAVPKGMMDGAMNESNGKATGLLEGIRDELKKMNEKIQRPQMASLRPPTINRWGERIG